MASYFRGVCKGVLRGSLQSIGSTVCPSSFITKKKPQQQNDYAEYE